MNVLHICCISNNKSSGISNVVPEHFLNQKKFINVALLNCNDEIIEKLKNEDNVYYYNTINNINNLKEPFNRPDLVVFHGIYIPQYIKLYKQLKKKNIPYIIVPHGSLTIDAQKTKKLKKIVGNLMLFNKFIYSSNYIQYLSASEASMSVKFKKNYFISGNGVTKPKFQKKDFSQKGLKIIYIGRYAICHKGIDIIIEACASIKDFLKKNNIKIDLFGSGNDGKEKAQSLVSKYGLENIISVNDAIFDEKKNKELLKHDVFIQTSRTEGQPLGIIEAMSLGLPIIASDGTTFGEIIKKNKNGYVGNNPKEISDIIIECYNNKDKLTTMSNNSILYSNNNFIWEKVVKKTISKYKKIINEVDV